MLQLSYARDIGRLAQALVTFIAQNLSAGQEQRIRSAIREAYKVLFCYTTLIVAVCLLFHDAMLGIFSSDRDMLAYGAVILVFEPLSYYFLVMRTIQEAKLRGHQRMLYYLISNVGTMAVNILFSALLVTHLGYCGFYLATYISAAAGLILSTAMVRKIPHAAPNR